MDELTMQATVAESMDLFLKLECAPNLVVREVLSWFLETGHVYIIGGAVRAACQSSRTRLDDIDIAYTGDIPSVGKILFEHMGKHTFFVLKSDTYSGYWSRLV